MRGAGFLGSQICERLLEAANLGNPNEFTIKQLAEIVIELTGSKSKPVFEPLPSDDPRQRQPNIAKARELLGWEPKIPLRDGLAKTIAYFDELLTSNDKPHAIAGGRNL